MKHTLFSAALAAVFSTIAMLPTPALSQKNCPPGLAKKTPACVPPGQARQGVTAEEWRNRHAPGDYLADDQWIALRDYDRNIYNGLPLLGAGETYAVVDGGVVVLSRTSSTILRLIDLLSN